MPAIAIILGVAGFVALWLKNSRSVNPAIVQTTPANGGVGIVGGFAPPAVETGVAVSPGGTQQNQPSTSGSGVPNTSSQTQEFNTAPYQAVPSPGFHSYYHPAQRGLLRPIASISQQSSPGASGGGSCGCKGGGGDAAPSDCATGRRGRNNGCLAPSKQSQIKNTPPMLIAQWASNIAGSGYDMFDVMQHVVNAQQDSYPVNETNQVPAAGPSSPIGFPAEGF
jgi:hypothetical protein